MSLIGRYTIDQEDLDIVKDDGKAITLVIRSEYPVEGDKLDRLRNGLADLLKLKLKYDGTPSKNLRESKKYLGLPLVYKYTQVA